MRLYQQITRAEGFLELGNAQRRFGRGHGGTSALDRVDPDLCRETVARFHQAHAEALSQGGDESAARVGQKSR